MEKEINGIFKVAGSALRSFSDGFKKNFIDISTSQVTDVLNNIEIKKSQYNTEKNVETIIANNLKTAFGKVHQQYNIGGYLSLKVDIDVGDGQVGLEIKLAKEFSTASAIERLFGQVLYYSRRTYKRNLIVVIVGTEKEQNQVLKEVQAIVEEQGVSFYYLIVK